MAQVRVAVSYHYTIDPATLTLSLNELPTQITRTIAVGDEIAQTQKVPMAALGDADREVIEAHLIKMVSEQTRTAKPIINASVSAPCATQAQVVAEQNKPEGMSLFD